MVIDSQTIIEDLGKMAELLNIHQICADNSPLYRMQTQMQNLPEDILWWYGSEEETYNYIKFKEFTMAHTRPHDAEVTVILAVKSKGKKVDIGKNPFEYLDVQIVLYGYALDENCNERHIKGAWHMDMDTNPNNNYAHPLFHINFGGKELEALGDTGEVLLLRSPRLMHPPMDIFLAIDFVVQNFYGRNEPIFQDLDYQRLIKKYRRFHWKYYSLAFAANFYNISSTEILNLKIDDIFSKNILGN